MGNRCPAKLGLGMLGKVGAVLIGVYLGMWVFQDNQLDSLRDKRVLVTGASTGIGEQLAYQYASLGCHVVVTSRRIEALIKVTKRCRELSPHNYTHHAVVGDMADMESTKRVIEEATSLLGGLDILVLNHISPQPMTAYTGSQENLTMLDKIMDVNFRSYVYLTSHALSQLIVNNGRIVVLNSLLGKVPHLNLSVYSASKHALHGFFGSLRNQFVSLGQNVAITICTLGYVGTDNAVREMQRTGSDMMKTITPASPESTAQAIVAASARREDEVYYPTWSIRAIVLLRSIFPQAIDSLMRH